MVDAGEQQPPLADRRRAAGAVTHGVDGHGGQRAQVAAAVGYTGETRWDSSKPDGKPRKVLDVGRLHALGWRASIPLAEGIAGTVAWYLAHAGTARG